MAKFVGHWVGCWATSANTTEHGDLQVVSLGDMKFKVTTDYVQYNGSSDCTGTPIPLFKEDSEATLVGETLVVEGITVEKITRTGQRTTYLDQTTHIHSVTAPVSPKGIAGVIDGATPTLRVGDDSVLDGQGYPSALWPMVYVKQPS